MAAGGRPGYSMLRMTRSCRLCFGDATPSSRRSLENATWASRLHETSRLEDSPVKLLVHRQQADHRHIDPYRSQDNVRDHTTVSGFRTGNGFFGAHDDPSLGRFSARRKSGASASVDVCRRQYGVARCPNRAQSFLWTSRSTPTATMKPTRGIAPGCRSVPIPGWAQWRRADRAEIAAAAGRRPCNCAASASGRFPVRTRAGP